MRHRKKGKVLGRKKAPREAMLRNLATSLIIYEKVKTTQVKAKLIRAQVEKLVTLAKADTLTNRRLALRSVYLTSAVKKLFEVLGPKFKERKGGYTRITKTLSRRGDGAAMAIIEFVE